MALRSRRARAGGVAALALGLLLAWSELRGGGVAGDGGGEIERLFAERRSGVSVEGAGVVAALLPDDDEGSRHQRFVLRLPSGHTLLVAHNLDLAPRVEDLARGDRVRFRGQYEWNERGGVLHWTHRDPAGEHADGWLEHAGTTVR